MLSPSISSRRGFTALNTLAASFDCGASCLPANIAGALVAALFYAFTPALSPELRDGAIEISRELLNNNSREMFFKSIPSGFLIAAMVWVIPNADTARFQMVALLTYLIAIGGFTHIVAGSVEAFLLVFIGELASTQLLGSS